MLHKLVEIPRRDWPRLRDLYKEDWPNHHISYYTVDNFIKWFKQDPDIKNCKIYSLNGDWSDGTYFIVNRYQVFCNTLNENQYCLIDGLSCLDPANAFTLSGVPERIKFAAFEYLDQFDHLKGRCDTTIWYYMPKEDAIQFNVDPPEGITLQPLTEAHAETVNKVWPFHNACSLFFVKSLIRLNLNVGAFNEKGELLAWCLRRPPGSLGLLQVKDEYKRKGLGNLVTRALSKMIAASGDDVCASVVEANVPSRSMFKKLGFKEVDTVYWMEKIAPRRDGEWAQEYDDEQ